MSPEGGDATRPLWFAVMSTFAERIEDEGNNRFLDSIIVEHGFTVYNRDYEITTLTVASLPPDVPIGETTGTYIDASLRYRFTHCPEVHLTTTVKDEIWRISWDDVFTDREAWEAHGKPDGFGWGNERADAYPGLFYVADSTRAASWSERLQREMHEVRVETNVFDLLLVCHELRIDKLAVGNPRTLTMSDLEQPEPL